MKKVSFKNLAIAGCVAGLCTLQTAEAAYQESQNKASTSYANEDPDKPMTEDALLKQLSSEGTKLYMSLSPEGKQLAREVASARCTGLNPCKGLNACKTDKNECNGKGACKGQGKCAQSDPNRAVELVAKKMAEKRAEALQQRN